MKFNGFFLLSRWLPCPRPTCDQSAALWCPRARLWPPRTRPRSLSCPRCAHSRPRPSPETLTRPPSSSELEPPPSESPDPVSVCDGRIPSPHPFSGSIIPTLFSTHFLLCCVEAILVSGLQKSCTWGTHTSTWLLIYNTHNKMPREGLRFGGASRV